MIEVNVKSIWHGQVGIRDKYYWLAKTKKEGILIRVEHDIMEIPYEELTDRVIARSEKPVLDKFSDPPEYHYLIYFNWNPKKQQRRLL